MNIFERMKLSAAHERLGEEALYQFVLQEMEHGLRRDGLWAKAFAASAGEMQKAHALYIEYRVQSLKDELVVASVKDEIRENLRRDSTAKQHECNHTSRSDPPARREDEIDSLVRLLNEYTVPGEICSMVKELEKLGYDRDSLVDLVMDRGHEGLARELYRLMAGC